MTSPQTPASSGSSLTSPSKGQEVEAVPAQGAVTSAAPLSVLLIDEDPERARQVEEGLIANAVVHTATQTHGRVLLDLIARISPDVIIMDCNSPDRDTIESLRLVAQSNPKPIVMFVEEEGGGGMQEAIEAGVSAYVIDGLTPKRVGRSRRSQSDRARERHADATSWHDGGPSLLLNTHHVPTTGQAHQRGG